MNLSSVKESYPDVISRLDLDGASYFPLNFSLRLEVDASNHLTLFTNEPLSVGVLGVFSFGVGSLDYKYLFKVESCSQANDVVFVSELVDLSRDILTKKVLIQSPSITAKESLERLCGFFGLNLILVGALPGFTQSLFLPFSVRNSLDQIKSIFKLDNWRYFFDLSNQSFYFLQGGSFQSEVLEIDYSFIKKEKENSVEFFPIPSLRPCLSFFWRGEEKIIDKVVLDTSQKKTEVRFV